MHGWRRTSCLYPTSAETTIPRLTPARFVSSARSSDVHPGSRPNSFAPRPRSQPDICPLVPPLILCVYHAHPPQKTTASHARPLPVLLRTSRIPLPIPAAPSQSRATPHRRVAPTHYSPTGPTIPLRGLSVHIPVTSKQYTFPDQLLRHILPVRLSCLYLRPPRT